MSLCRIEVITSLAKFSSLKSALSKAGVRGMTVMQVLGSVFLNKRDKRNILKKLNFMVDKHNSQWYYN
ncbi:MAG: P-II family nitrogen regulator [Blautia massiliensis (ex Durand et al. 2017)]